MDLYVVLGARREMSLEELKKCYKKEAMKWHPDRHSMKSEAEKQHAEDQFKLVSEANAVLQDPEKKRIYDEEGFKGLQHFMTRQRNDAHYGKTNSKTSHPTDPFENYISDTATQATFDKTRNKDMFANYSTDSQTQKAFNRAKSRSVFESNRQPVGAQTEARAPFATTGHAAPNARPRPRSAGTKSGARTDRPSSSRSGIHSDWDALGAAAATTPPSDVPDLLSKIGRAPITEKFAPTYQHHHHQQQHQQQQRQHTQSPKKATGGSFFSKFLSSSFGARGSDRKAPPAHPGQAPPRAPPDPAQPYPYDNTAWSKAYANREPYACAHSHRAPGWDASYQLNAAEAAPAPDPFSYSQVTP